MRKSKEETARTRQHIVAEASKFILRNGIETSGVAEIMNAAGLTQGGFYRHFDSKEQLIAEACAATFVQLEAKFKAAIKNQSPREAIDTIVAVYLAQHSQRADQLLCPNANLGTEFHRLDPQLKAIAYEGHRQFVGLIQSQLSELGGKRPAAVASAIGSLLVGAMVVSRLAPSAELEKTILKEAHLAIQSMLKD